MLSYGHNQDSSVSTPGLQNKLVLRLPGFILITGAGITGRIQIVFKSLQKSSRFVLLVQLGSDILLLTEVILSGCEQFLCMVTSLSKLSHLYSSVLSLRWKKIGNILLVNCRSIAPANKTEYTYIQARANFWAHNKVKSTHCS